MFESMSDFYFSGKTRPVSFRMHCLRRLRNEILNKEDEILHALFRDLGKPAMEAYTSEVGFVVSEINHAIKSLSSWMKQRRVKSPLLFWPAKSFVIPEPHGVVLIIGPWNYPFQLLMTPFIGALSAGNCAVLKPSKYSTETAGVIKNIINRNFQPDHCRVVLGDEESARGLTDIKWDHIFFTGSTEVGREIMIKAAENLTPVTLELGGKSPCFVFEDADLRIAAERIAWGKFMNAGQTCVAPDMIYCHKSIKDELLSELQNVIPRFYGPDPEKSPDYARIINTRQFERLVAYLKEGGRVVMGGRHDREKLYFDPTIITDVPPEALILREEIFGPIMPVLSFEDINDLIHTLQKEPRPLALYVFTNKKYIQRRIIKSLPSGTVGINDTVKQAASPYLPFGGTGESGMGNYHGKASFDCFTHFRSVISNSGPRLGLNFPPYGKNIRFIKKLFRFFY